MAFMAFGDEVSCSSTYNILNECNDYENDDNDDRVSDKNDNCNYDDEAEMLLLKMHASLEEACGRNRKLKEKNDALILTNSKLVRELNTAKDVCKKLQEREKYYDNVRKGQNILKRRINDLAIMLQLKKKQVSENWKFKHVYNKNRYTSFVRNGMVYLKENSNYINNSLKCFYCMQQGHFRKYCYVKKNENLGMKTKWLEVEGTSSS